MHTFPWALPALAIGVVLAGVAARPLGRAICAPAWSAFMLAAGVALVVSVTLTPLRSATDGPATIPQLPAHPVPIATGAGLWRWLWQWWPVDERTLNIALLIPLGMGVGLVGRRWLRWLLVALALLLPPVVEGAQYLIGPLARDADWRDVVDNATGVLIGLLIGVLVRRAGTRRDESRAG